MLRWRYPAVTEGRGFENTGADPEAAANTTVVN